MLLLYTVYTTETAPELGHVSEVATKPESEVPSEVGQGPVPGSAQVQKASEVALEAFEGTLDEETRERYTVRFEEGYDLEIDELYTVWMKLKSLSINEKSTESQHGHFEDTSVRDKHSRQLRSRAQSKAAENGQRQKEQQQKEAAPATRLSQQRKRNRKECRVGQVNFVGGAIYCSIQKQYRVRRRELEHQIFLLTSPAHR